MLESAQKISELSIIPTTNSNCIQQNKISVDDTYFLVYGKTSWGIKYNKRNYKLSLSQLRTDIKGYITLESLNTPWVDTLKLWYGTWDNENLAKSYIIIWDENKQDDSNYFPNKFNDLENSYYIINDAPFPFETEDLNNRNAGETENNVKLYPADPYKESKKINLKSYVDARMAGLRLVEVKPSFSIRDYECVYVIREKDLTDNHISINISNEVEERIKHDTLQFTVAIEGRENNGIFLPVLNENIVWEFKGSDKNVKELVWTNKDDNLIPLLPDTSEAGLYKNSKYILFTFKLVTSDIFNKEIFEEVNGKLEKTSEKSAANFSVYGVCENLLYVTSNYGESLISSDNTISINQRVEKIDGKYTTIFDLNFNITFQSKTKNIEIVKETPNIINFEAKSIENIISSDNTINITKKIKKYTTKYDLSSDVSFTSDEETLEINKEDNIFDLKTNVKGVENLKLESLNKIEDGKYSITFADSHNKAYYTSDKDFTLEIDCNNLETDETMSINLFLNTYQNEENANIKSAIRWVMQYNGDSPDFVPNRLYDITLTYVPEKALFAGISNVFPVFGAINNFYYITGNEFNDDESLEPCCEGTRLDISTFNNGVLTLNWPTKQCGELKYTTGSADYSTYLNERSIIFIEGSVPELLTGNAMFAGSHKSHGNIEECNIENLDLLWNGDNMFAYNKLTEWSIELPLLEMGNYMFSWNNLKEWNISLPSLTSCSHMFCNNNEMISCLLDAPNATNCCQIFKKHQGNEYYPNESIISLTLNLHSLEEVNLASYEELPTHLGYLSKLQNVIILPGGLDNVKYFEFPKDANDLTYESMNNVAEALPDKVGDEDYIYKVPVANTTLEERNEIRDICEEKGWDVIFVTQEGEEINDPRPSCEGSEYDISIFANGILTLDWPTKTCGEAEYTTGAADFSLHLGLSEIISIDGNADELISASGMFAMEGINRGAISSCDLESLDNLEIGTKMFYYNSLRDWNIDLPALKNGELMFAYNLFETWNTNLPSLENGISMFENNHLVSVISDMPKLIDGTDMFYLNEIQSFEGDLSSLEIGTGMFKENQLMEWNTDLPSLKTGKEMFISNSLITVNADFSSLTDGTRMFENNQIAFWDNELPKLINGEEMFANNKLEEWSVSLPELENGTKMFANNDLSSCILDMPSANNLQGILEGNTHITNLTINLPNMTNISFVDSSNEYSLGEINSLVNLTIIEGGLDSVENFTFNSKNNVLTYESMLNVANALPSYEDGEHVYTCPINNTSYTERNTIREIAESKGWTVKFVDYSGSEIEEAKISCEGTDYDNTIIDNNELIFDWPTKTCGEPENNNSLSPAYFYNYSPSSASGYLGELISADRMFLYDATGSTKLALKTPLVAFNVSDLDNLETAVSMFKDNNLQTWNIDLPKLNNGSYMFYGNDLMNWNIDLPKLNNGSYMFYGNNIVSYGSNLPLLTDGSYMFYGNDLINWDIDLPKLINGSYMFYNNGIENWSNDMPNLTDGSYMFYGNNIVSCESDLPKLINGSYMFYNNSIENWDNDMPNLTNGSYMFYNNQLVHFAPTDITNLQNGNYMFYNNRFTLWTYTSFDNLLTANYMFKNSLDMGVFDMNMPLVTQVQGILSMDSGANAILKELNINLPKLTKIDLSNSNDSMSLGELTGLTTVSVENGGLASVGTFTFSKNATSLTYQSILNVANALPKYTSGTHIYTAPGEQLSSTQRFNIKNIIEPKGWTMLFVDTSGAEILEATCEGTSRDISTYSNGTLTLNWPTKQCGNTSNMVRGSSSYFANNKGNITKVTGSIPELVIGGGDSYTEGMFSQYNLTSVSLDSLGKLEQGNFMFNVNKLSSWNIALPNTLKEAKYMFSSNNFTSWNVDLPNSLSDASYMFYDNRLTSWNKSLPASLKNANGMFASNLFSSWSIDLPNSLTNTNSMFGGCSNLSSWNKALPSNVTDTGYMFSGTALSSWNVSLPNTIKNTRNMFANTNLTSWNITLPTLLTDASYMFYRTKLATWNTTLPSKLENASYMFYQAGDDWTDKTTGPLKSFNVQIPSSVKNTEGMFVKTGLTTFNSSLSSVTNASVMFSNCFDLKTVTISSLANLEDANHMFYRCEALTTFNCPSMPKLKNAVNMIAECKSLSAASCLSIANALPNVSGQSGEFIFNPYYHPESSTTSYLIPGWTSQCTSIVTNKGWTVRESK